MTRNVLFVIVLVLCVVVGDRAGAELTEAQCRSCSNAQLICGATACESCSQDSQCQQQFGSVSVCRSANDTRAECDISTGCLCVHKSLISDGISFSDIGPALVMILGGAAAAGSDPEIFFFCLFRCIPQHICHSTNLVSCCKCSQILYSNFIRTEARNSISVPAYLFFIIHSN